MFKLISKIVGVVIMVIVLGYVSVCAITSYKSCGLDTEDAPEASYLFTVKVTGALIYTDDYDVENSENGDSRYIIHGFWENGKSGFVYKDMDLTLDGKYFGEIDITVLK